MAFSVPSAENLKQYSDAFEKSEFYEKVQDGSREALEDALQLLADQRVDVRLTSHQEATEGWTYLHLIVDRLKHSKLFSPESFLSWGSFLHLACWKGLPNGQTPLLEG